MFLFDQLIQAKTPDFTRWRLYEIVKLVAAQRNIGDFYKDFFIKQIEKSAYHHSCYKKIGKTSCC